MQTLNTSQTLGLSLIVLMFLALFAAIIAGVSADKKEDAEVIEQAAPVINPSPDFVAGFNAGVRYGLIARMQDPEEDSIKVLTDRAKAWYINVEKVENFK